ncbi:hypothetical protein CCP4SC76_890001 [Gammaproteobacteria bacterium]
MAEQIETATGMDFERFTRSMLLAQGGFAAFLQAAPDQRAPILEQITGTEIYSQISIRVHERHGEERKRLDALQRELAGMPLLTPEDEQQLTVHLAHQTRQDSELTQQIDQNHPAMAWIEGIVQLEGKLKSLGQQKEALQTRMEAFAPDQERLAAATRALEFAADYAALTALRQEQEADGRTLGECQEFLPNRIDAAKRAEGVMNLVTLQLETRKAEQQKAQPIIRKVRELDLKIAEKETPIKTAHASIAERSTALDALRTRQHADAAELNRQRAALEALLQRLETTKVDQGLVEQLTGIRGRFEALQNLNGQWAAKLQEIHSGSGFNLLRHPSDFGLENLAGIRIGNLVLWGLKLTIRLPSRPMLTPMTTIASALGLESHFGKAFSGLAGHNLIATLGDFIEAGRTTVKGQADGIKEGRLPSASRTRNGKDSIGRKGRMRKVNLPFTQQRVEIFESYLQYPHPQISYSARASSS